MAGKKEKKDGSPVRIRHVLREIPFFEDFSEDEIDFFSRNVSLCNYPEHTVLFKTGDVADYLFFVVEGLVEVRLGSPESKQIVATFDRGCCVGEMSILDDYPRSATIVVTRPAELLIFSREGFEHVCREAPRVGVKFLQGLAKNLSIRLRKATGTFADLA